MAKIGHRLDPNLWSGIVERSGNSNINQNVGGFRPPCDHVSLIVHSRKMLYIYTTGATGGSTSSTAAAVAAGWANISRWAFHKAVLTY